MRDKFVDVRVYLEPEELLEFGGGRIQVHLGGEVMRVLLCHERPKFVLQLAYRTDALLLRSVFDHGLEYATAVMLQQQIVEGVTDRGQTLAHDLLTFGLGQLDLLLLH